MNIKISKVSIVILLLISCMLISCSSKTKDIVNDDEEIEEDEEEATETAVTEEPEIKQEDKKETLDEKALEENNQQNEQSQQNQQNQQSQSVSRKTVVIDPGHGGGSNLEKEKQSPDSNILKIKDGGGCEGVSTKVREATVNLQVSMKLKALLEANNINVIMTRTDDSRTMGNIERAEIGNKNNASLSIRIHCDSADNQSAKGASMLVPGKVGYAKDISDISNKYGKIILNSLVSKAGMNNRGIIVSNDMTGFNWSKVPIVLIELGFMSNPDEDRLLVSDSYQNKMAEGLCDGILKAIN